MYTHMHTFFLSCFFHPHLGSGRIKCTLRKRMEIAQTATNTYTHIKYLVAVCKKKTFNFGPNVYIVAILSALLFISKPNHLLSPFIAIHMIMIQILIKKRRAEII